MIKSEEEEVPDCIYGREAESIRPSGPTPKHALRLSNIDEQKLLRFSIKYVYLYKKAVRLEGLKAALARVLVEYYPLAGRVRRVGDGDEDDKTRMKLEVDCNGQGALFAEAHMESTAEQLLELESCKKPNKAWRKMLYRVEADSFLDVPPLVVQVTTLRCGGMILCTAICHCLCDGIGTSQFLHAWAQLTRNSDLTVSPSPLPFHWRHVLQPRHPPRVAFPHPGFSSSPSPPAVDLFRFLRSRPLVPTSFTFPSSHLVRLKTQCFPPLPCTAFETLAAHTWRSWVRSIALELSLPPALLLNLLFSVNIRAPANLPRGFYGNGFLLACAQCSVADLVASNLHRGVKAVQDAKARLNDVEYIRSMVDLLEDKSVNADLSRSLVISQWSRLGLEDVDFGEGKPLHVGPLTTDIYCLFLPVVGDANALRVLLSVPDTMVQNFHHHMLSS